MATSSTSCRDLSDSKFKMDNEMKLTKCIGVYGNFLAVMSILSLTNQVQASESSNRYSGYQSYDCSGEELKFESLEELTQSTSPVIVTYIDHKKEEYECQSAAMEELVVRGTLPKSLTWTLFWTTDNFYDAYLVDVKSLWSTDLYTFAVGIKIPASIKANANKVLREYSFRLSEEMQVALEDALAAEYSIAAEVLDGNTLGRYYNKDRRIVIDVAEILESSKMGGTQYFAAPDAFLFQVLLHEMIHAGRYQFAAPKENKDLEETIVRELTYDIFKAILKGKEPPLKIYNYSDAHDKYEHNTECYSKID